MSCIILGCKGVSMVIFQDNYIYIYRQRSPVVRLGGLAPARQMISCPCPVMDFHGLKLRSVFVIGVMLFYICQSRAVRIQCSTDSPSVCSGN